jgi:hypothetical protein
MATSCAFAHLTTIQTAFRTKDRAKSPLLDSFGKSFPITANIMPHILARTVDETIIDDDFDSYHNMQRRDQLGGFSPSSSDRRHENSLQGHQTFNGQNGFYSFSALLSRRACSAQDKKLCNGLLALDAQQNYTTPVNPNYDLFPPAELDGDLKYHLLDAPAHTGNSHSTTT